MRLNLRCVVTALLLIVARDAYSQDCADPVRKDAGHVCATLAIQQGRWTIAPQSFVLKRGMLPATISEAQVLASLQSAVETGDFPYRLGLDPDARKKDEQQPGPDYESLRSFSGSWMDYAVSAIEKGIDPMMLVDNVSTFLTDLKKSTAFLTPDRDTFVGDTGAVQLDVAAFTTMTPIRVAGAGQSQKRAKALEGYLKKESNALWNTNALVARVKSYYSYIGLDPTVNVDPVLGAIEIVEGTRISQINLPAVGDANGEINALERAKALYSVLDDRDFRLVLKKGITGEKIIYGEHLERKMGEEPFFFPARAQVQQLWLAQSNLALTTAPIASVALPAPWTLTQQYVGIRVLKPQPEAPPSPAEAPSAADDSGLITPTATETGGAEDRGIDAVKERERPVREKHHYVGAAFAYRPGQGVSVSGIYQLSKIDLPFMTNSFGVRVEQPTDHGVTPSINYAADYIFFNKIHRRVSFHLNGASVFTNNRFLEGTAQDETREGGMGRIEIELFRDRGGSLLRFHVEGSKNTITRRIADQPDVKNKLTALDAGALFMKESWETIHPWRFRFTPAMRWGLARSDDPGFTRFDGLADAHVQLEKGYAFDVSGSFRITSADTPVFELPSLGGPDSIRGFQPDDATGRIAWSLQNEFWTPMPLLSNLQGGAGDFFRKMVRMAFFGDVGNVHDVSSGSLRGTRAGAGLGARVQFGAIVLKGDFAYGFGPQTIPGSRGKFYFTVKTNLPF